MKSAENVEKMEKVDPVVEFIRRRFGSTDAHWQDGNCYYFSVILKDRFPGAEICYEPVVGHFVAKIGEKYYDSLGENIPSVTPIPLRKIEQTDPLWAEGIRRDCIS